MGWPRRDPAAISVFGEDPIGHGIKYETNWRRILLAYIAGSLLAGAVFTIGFAIIITISDAYTANTTTIWDWPEIQGALLLWVIVSSAWLAGQTMLVSLPWFMLHTSGRTHWKYAVALGVFTVPVTAAFMGLNLFWGYAGFALWGGVMARLIWRIAYFKSKATAAPKPA